MIRVVFEGSLEDVHQAMHTFVHGEKTSAAATSVPKKTEKAKVAEAPAETKPAATSVPTVEDVKATITQMLAVEKIGKPGVITFFANHYAPAKKASELPAEKYGEFIAKAKELMGS